MTALASVLPASLPAPAPRSARVIQATFTPYARRDRYASMTLYGPAATEAVKAVLNRLQLAPGAVRVRGTALGDVALLSMAGDPSAPEAPAAPQPVAFLDGVPKDELCEALATLAGERWQPSPPVLSFVERSGA